MDIFIGSNQLRNTNGIFIADNHNLIKIETNDVSEEILLSMHLFNPAGTQIAKLDRNDWTSNEQKRFELKIQTDSVMILDNTLKGVVIIAKKEGSEGIHIPQAKFYLPGGTVSEVTNEHWHVGNKIELKDANIDLNGGAIEIE